MLARAARFVIASGVLAACGLDAVGQSQQIAPDVVREDAAPLIPGDAGYVPPPEDAPPPDGNCGDTLSNSQQCGACGHSCGGSACVDGVCTAEPVTTVSAPNAIALGANDVYIATAGNIRRVPFSAGAPVDLPETGGALSIAVSEPKVFYVTQSSYNYKTTEAVPSGSDVPSARGRDLVFGGGRLFFSLASNGGVQSRDSILNDVGRTHSTGTTDPYGLALDDANVYWVDRAAKAIMKAAHTATGVPIVMDQDGLSSIAVDSVSMYWTTATEIRRANKEGKELKVLTTGLQEPRSLVANKTFLYWIDAKSGDVKRMPITGGTPLVIARNKPLPDETSARLIAVNDTHVYWVSPNDNAVARLPK